MAGFKLKLYINDLEKKKIKKAKELLFYKRIPYKIENEYRIIYPSKIKSDEECHRIPIEPDVIKKITLSSKFSGKCAECIKETILKKYQEWKFDRNSINHSTLIDNERWKKIADRAAETIIYMT